MLIMKPVRLTEKDFKVFLHNKKVEIQSELFN